VRCCTWMGKRRRTVGLHTRGVTAEPDLYADVRGVKKCRAGAAIEPPTVPLVGYWVLKAMVVVP